jgi:hypothetical protein
MCLLLGGCVGVPTRPVYRELKIPAPALSSSEQIRKAAKTTADGTKDVQYRTRTIKEEIVKIQEIVPPEVAERLKKVEFQLDETLVKLADMETANDLLSQQISVKEAAEIRMRDWGITQQTIADTNAKGWQDTAYELAQETKNHQKSKLALAKAEEDDKRKRRFISILSSSTLFFLGLRFVKIATLQTWLFPVGGAVIGWLFSRFAI